MPLPKTLPNIQLLELDPLGERVQANERAFRKAAE